MSRTRFRVAIESNAISITTGTRFREYRHHMVSPIPYRNHHFHNKTMTTEQDK
jgi:hypothetical protein